LRPIYPLNFSRMLTSTIESPALSGDPVHLNDLGHLALARAVYDAIARPLESPSKLSLSGWSEWTAKGVESHLVATNTGNTPRSGRLEIYGPMGADLEPVAPVAYCLKPGRSVTTSVFWTQVKRPEDLLVWPGRDDVSAFAPTVCVADFVGRTEVGRTDLLWDASHRSKPAWIGAELAYVRFGEASTGEAGIDGDLGEWSGSHFSPIGEPVQARWTHGPEDHRAPSDGANVWFATRAGKTGFTIAFRGVGRLQNDTVTVWLDNRPQKMLGTVGPYYWLTASFPNGGAVDARPGETSPQCPGLTGRWIATKGGLTAEVFVPYSLMNAAQWPVSGDLGLSIDWTHQGTHLMWSEDGHPWNPRWFGVVRRTDAPVETLPYVVHVR
jgi:hypothetical protein